jgi:uncharacterized repeat protein (TIGR03803 family)
MEQKKLLVTISRVMAAGMWQRTASATLALAFVLVATVVATPSAQAQRFKVLYTFTGGADGGYPVAGLIQDAAGNLYGTTGIGGASGGGTVFVVNKAGHQETVLYSFTGTPDGAIPEAGLIQDAAGNFYGTTADGGVYNVGTVFAVNKAGQEKVLYSFTGGADGANPWAGLIQDAAGNFYGTTLLGGAYGYGTVFVVSKTGQEKVLYSFTGGADGAIPWAGLIQDAAGNLFGTTVQGGAYGVGTVFVVNKTGQEKVLHSFTYGADGEYPQAGLIQDAAGNLFGTTIYGGAYGSGTVFEVKP